MVTSTRLAVGQVVRYPEPPNQEPEYLDGYRNFFNLTAAPGLPRLIMNRGIDHPAATSAPEGKRRSVILLRSNPLQAGSAKTPWHDVIALERRKVVYYGDHRADTAGPLGSTRGNAALLRAAEAHTSNEAAVRRLAVPLLIFRSVEVKGQPKGYLEFCGLGTIDSVTAIQQEDPRNRTSFSNYVFNISLLDLSFEGGCLDWRWLNARRDPDSTLEETHSFAPRAWLSWVGAQKTTNTSEKKDAGASVRSPDWAWDELILACALVYRNNWREIKRNDPRAAELSNLLQKLPIHPLESRGKDFRNVNSIQRKTANIVTAHPNYRGAATKGGRATQEVVKAFLANPDKMLAAADKLIELIKSEDSDIRAALATPNPDEEETSAREGRILERLHRYRERNRSLRAEKIKSVLASDGKLVCEVCRFDFTKFYGTHGDGYIEVHHVVPLHEAGESETKLSDLALLCANCHRMSHRRLEATGTWPTPEHLRALIR
ncbi:HNH endonuclease [Actinomadura formosensis]|uniref:HNH endonuclease n=1 Tax=Actinomadura formosensis TaxID=60706 RepID=UPI003D91B616